MPRWIRLGLMLSLLIGCEPTSEQSAPQDAPAPTSPPAATSVASTTPAPAPLEDHESATAPSAAPTLNTPPTQASSSASMMEEPQEIKAPEPTPAQAPPKLKPLHWNAKGYAKAPWSIPKGQELDLFTENPLTKLQEVLAQRYPLASQLDEAFAWLKTQPQVAKVTWIREQDTLQIQIKKGAFGFYRPSDARPRHNHP